jgi:hypothetical protein
MNLQNTEKLLKAFPNLYRSVAQTPIADAARFNFQIDDGWFELLVELSKEVEAVAKRQNLSANDWPDVKIVEAQNASLRFNLHQHNDEMHKTAYKFERKSLKTCEKCGKPGKVRDSIWLETLCDACNGQH